MKALITGGAGFIGSNLVEYHLMRGDEVLVIDDLTTGLRENLQEFENCAGYRFVQADILEWNGLDEAVAWADRIYHLAAVVGMFRVLAQPVDVTRVNVIGCERVLEAVARTGSHAAVVIASSSCVYGHAATSHMREDVDLTLSPGSGGLTSYSVSKLTNEIQALSYAQKYKIPVFVIRFFNTVGQRQSGVYGFVLPRFIQQALTGVPLTVFGDGQQTRSFCDVRDTIGMVNALVKTPEARGQIVNVGHPREITIRDLADLVRYRTGSDSPVEYVPFAIGYGEEVKQITQRRPNLDRLLKLTGYQHQWSLEDTIDHLIAYYQATLPRDSLTVLNLRDNAA